jgi:serine/threonine protein kinase
VESLLAHDNEGTQVLKSVVSEAASKLAGSPDRHIDSKIGPYRILRRLDEGGMGVVYAAERSDEHYLQTVAIKLVKTGMDSREIVNRFRAERQILANLTHPNVAAILDGGSTEYGLPYIVMEYIDGLRITDFAAARQFTVRERIHLFLPVCLAVHYAHQKLVIHRDIKQGQHPGDRGWNSETSRFRNRQIVSRRRLSHCAGPYSDRNARDDAGLQQPGADPG